MKSIEVVLSSGEVITFNVGQVVRWLNCPSSISGFANTKILAISDCGNFAQLGFIAGWISLKDLKPCDDPKAIAFWDLYK